LLPDVLANAHFYHVYPVYFLIFVAVLVVTSLLTPPPHPDRLACVAPVPKAVQLAASPVWFRSYRFWLVLYLAALVAVYVVFN
jgi:hypothetical protein